MAPNEIRSHLRRQPFAPFRLYLSDGASYLVKHPEMAIVSMMDVVIAVGGEKDIPERVVFCDPRHVTRIEPVAANGSGRGHRKK